MARTDLSLSKTGFLAQKFFGRLPVEHAWALYLFNKHARIQEVLHKMKYHNMPELAELAGEKLGLALNELHAVPAFDLIIPVPLHKSKLKRRGYNQSNHFGVGLSRHLNRSVAPDCVIRVKDTATQTAKSRVERWRNVSEIFRVTDEKQLIGKNVLLVDDVITTGSTIEACGQTLFDSGINSLSIAAMAAAK
ncbi:MAG: ComF family protein [Bacteroidota bacterium]